MIQFTTTILKFGTKGEKSGWTYIDVPADLANSLHPGNRKAFKVKGKLDKQVISGMSLLPMGGGTFILVLNAAIRKAVAKKTGALIHVKLEKDESSYIFNSDFIACLAEEPAAKLFFESLPGSHQRYFNNWIKEAKTDGTRVKRIALTINSLVKRMGFSEMIRASKAKI